MSGKLVCSACGQALPPALAIERTNEGWPTAASVDGEMGLPRICPPVPFDIFLDGVEASQVIAYSIPGGFVLRNTGQIIDGEMAVERVDGVVTLAVRQSQGERAGAAS